MDDVRGAQGTGSVLSLNAMGRQESYLLGSFQNFYKRTLRHTNFSKCQFVQKVDATPGVADWPFGQTVLVTLKPQQMGDLMTNMYLRCTLPLLQDVVEFNTVYTDQVGRAILQKAIFRVDTQEIETVYTDWNIIKDELYLTADQKNSMKYLVNGGQDLGALPTSSIKSGPIDVYVPLNFFFSNNSETFFPTCAIHQQQIVISLTFNAVQFFSNSHTIVNYPGSPYTCSMSSFEIVCEQIIVSPEERLYLQNGPKTLLIESPKLQPQLQIPQGTQNIKNFITSSVPIETFHWFLRRSNYEQPAGDFLNRFNYGDTTSYDPTVQGTSPMMSDAKFYVNGSSELGFMEGSSKNNPQSSYYYKYLEPNTCSLSTPTRNIYTHSFALNPLEGPLTGALDFKTLTTDRSFIDLSLLVSATNSYVMNMFHMSLVTLRFEGGFLTILE